MTIMLWTYALKAFAEKLNKIKVDGDGVTHMMNFSGTTTDFTLKRHHTRGYPIIYCIKDYKQTYLYYTSGDTNQMHESIVVTNYFMQDQ